MNRVRALAVVVLVLFLLGDMEQAVRSLQIHVPFLPTPRAWRHSSADLALRPGSGVRFWRNRSGPLNAEFHFSPSDYRELAGYWVTKVSKTRRETANCLSRYWRLERAGQSIWVEIHLHTDSTAAAQDGMLSDMIDNSNYAALGGWISLGEREGLSLGDISLIYGRHQLEEPLRLPDVRFVRNNIRVRVSCRGTRDLDVLPLARAIDARIRRQPARWPGISMDTPPVSLRIQPGSS